MGEIVRVGAERFMPLLDIQNAKARRDAVVAIYKELMVRDIDYGQIPGTAKPTLLKPGAERLCSSFGLTPTFHVIKEAEDWTGEQHGGEPFFYYWYKCKLWRGDALIAEGEGSCNSRESRYRWRWVNEADVPPGLDLKMLAKRPGAVSEFAFAVEKGETSGRYGKPAEYWQMFRDAIEAGTARQVTRTTKNSKTMSAWEIDTTVYRVPNEDIASQVNTILKMAQKRALIAVTLIAVNASEFFTQDVEDLEYIDANYRPVAVPTVAEVEMPPPLEPKPAPSPQPRANGKPLRPWDAETLRRAIREEADKYNDDMPNDKQFAKTHANLSNLTGGDDKQRRAITAYLFGKSSSKELTYGECRALVRWVAATKQADDEWVPDPTAVQEAAAVVRAYQVEQGQQEMALVEVV